MKCTILSILLWLLAITPSNDQSKFDYAGVASSLLSTSDKNSFASV